jgi:hypothetical protein
MCCGRRHGETRRNDPVDTDVIFGSATEVLSTGGHIAVIIGPTQHNGEIFDHAHEFEKPLEGRGKTEMYATKNFLSRSEQQRAEMTLVQEKLSGYGVATQYSGDASDHLDKVDIRRARIDREALAARFRPNQIMVAGGGRSALCEAKSESRAGATSPSR